ncbi:immunoglobulin superfamily member 1-like isoform X3 [Mauremys mutica]|uniref:immunoglobulin superfamily member 1-like isoform X3 n=1 Tax=Mauremys mutica TaxID=74926 RepID=UPI001D163C6E|nr:immunoglobulin superfamily member 1-like isoform X3 [Mauremys mutica]
MCEVPKRMLTGLNPLPEKRLMIGQYNWEGAAMTRRCWLAGHSGVWGEPSYPKPSISGIPSEGVSLGGSVSIWCKGQHHAVQFVLNKDGRHLQSVDSDSQALFLISNVSREDGGSYSCSYRSKSEPFKMSDPSDPVELVVRDPELPRPSISLSLTSVTAPGADATIRCQGQRRDVSFFLYKAGDLNPQRHMDPAGDVAEFRIPTMGRQHGGNYSCSYRPRSEPFVSSEPSDPVEIIVSDAGSIPATGTDPTQPGAVPAPTRLDSLGPGSRPLTWAIIAGMSVAAAGLLLLLFLVAFVCFRKIRATVPPQRSRISAPAEGFLYKEPSAPCLSGTWGARGANLWIRKRSRIETKQHQPYGGIKGSGSARPPLHLHRQRERDADPVMSRERVPSAPPSWPRHEMLPTPGPCSLRTYRSACRDTTDPHPPAPGCSDIGWLPVASVSLNFCLKSPPKSASPHK